MAEAVIVATSRTAIGRAGKGSFVDARPDDMSAFIIDDVLGKVPELPHDQVEDVIWGTAQPGGEQGYNLGRVAGLLAGLNAPGTTVNRYCSSSLQTIRMAAHAIRAGEGTGAWTPPVGLPDVYIAMGQTAENVAEHMGVSRQAQDEWGVRSQNRAEAAQARGFFEREISPYTLPDGTVVSSDDGIRPGTTYEKVSQLSPVFRPDGTVTAGNACPLNDGAAAVVVMSDTRAAELGIRPLARIISSGVSALSPEIMGLGPIQAIRQALGRAGMTPDDIDLFEINEAFAAQVLPSADEVGIDLDKLNVNGGAIALGHPFGMTGARIMTTLLNGLEDTDGEFGVEAMCVGGGQGMAMVVQRLS